MKQRMNLAAKGAVEFFFKRVQDLLPNRPDHGEAIDDVPDDVDGLDELKNALVEHGADTPSTAGVRRTARVASASPATASRAEEAQHTRG